MSGLGRDLPELQAARALWQRRAYRESLEMFEKAVEKHPQNVIALIDASRAFGSRYEIDRAEQLLDRLIDLAGARADILHLAGQSYRMIFRPDRAIECFEQALDRGGKEKETHLELAILFERRSRLEEARLHVDECLKGETENFEARLVKGRLLRRLKDETAAENMLRDLTLRDDAHWVVRSQAWAELAQLLDKWGQYDEAMSAMRHGKEVLMQYESATMKDGAREWRKLCQLTDALTREDLLRWQEAAPQFSTKRVALLTGPPRSGTTLLEKVLDSHPDIVSSDERAAFPQYIVPSLLLGQKRSVLRPSYFDAISIDDLNTERDRYLRYLEDALNEPVGDRFHIDKNPSILMLIPAMLRLFPECRFLIALRDPRDVVLSCFMRYLPMNTISVYFHTLDRTVARYERDMRAWLKFREILPAPWIETRYEDAVDDLEHEARRAVDFFDVPWDDCVMNYRDRLRDRPANSPTYEAVSQPLYRTAVGRWKNYERHLAPVMPALNRFAREFGYD